MAITGPELPLTDKSKRKREEDIEGALEARPSASPHSVRVVLLRPTSVAE